MVLETDPYTAWVAEPLVKEKRDIELIGEYVTAPKCDVAEVNRVAEAFGQRGLVRGYICCFDVFGQPGTWQDATCLAGVERMIMETYDDPAWVHEFLAILWAAEEGLRRVLGGGPLRYSRAGRGQRLLLGDLAEDLRRVRRPLRRRVDRPGVPRRPADLLSYLRRHDGHPRQRGGHEAQRHGDLYAAGHGRRRRPGRSPPADPAKHLHDRRLRPVPFLQGLHGRADPRRGPPLLPGGRFPGRLYPLSFRQLLRRRAGTGQGLRRRSTEVRLPNHRRTDHAA